MSNVNSRSLFWEEEVPGRTQLQASIVHSYLDSHRVTYYEIKVRVSSEEENAPDLRIWKVKRRYSEFAALHKALGDLGFPCPSLPPRQLWGGHTSSFMISRENALNLWIQGVVVIWQSAAPNRGPSVAYAIGELLEAFLCSEDSESFYRTLEEVQVGSEVGWQEDLITPRFAGARTRQQIGGDAVPAPPRSATEMHQSVQKQPSFAQVALETRRSKAHSSMENLRAAAMVSRSPFLLEEGARLGKLPQSRSTGQLPPLPGNNSVRSSPLLSPGRVGTALAREEAAGLSAQEYETYNERGERIMKEFHPYIVRVEFPNARGDDSHVPAAMRNACTPVSVPPTPAGQEQFNKQWQTYTHSVLDFVQDRLNMVQRNNNNFNILDRHSRRTRQGGQNVSDEEEEEESSVVTGEEEESRGAGVAAAAATPAMLVVDLMTEAKPRYTISMQPSPNSREELSNHSTGGGELDQSKRNLVASYVRAGEHLIQTILREAQADIADWQFVSTTKDVIVMRRLRPIRKRNLLSNAASHRSPETGMPASSSSTPSFDTSQYCFMGRGVVDAPAEVIFDFVRRPDKRHLYDEMLNEELVLENWAVGEDASRFEQSNIGNLLVYYHLFKTNRCFLRYMRDFCVMQFAKKVVQRGQPTKYVVVGASINHSNCPLREGVERATLDLFGWVVEPTARPNQSKVSYMMHIDFGKGGVPTHLLNTISFRQPLAVHYLRRHVKAMESGGERSSSAAAAGGEEERASTATSSSQQQQSRKKEDKV